MEILKVEKISVNFNGVHALSEINFRMEKGEYLGIIGPNGAGKTTLFNVINGQLKPNIGKIFLYEKEVTKSPPHKLLHLGMGRAFQITSLFFELSIIDNVLLALYGNKISRFQFYNSFKSNINFLNKSKELISLINLWGKKDELVKNISYGEQRLLEIIVSISSNPNILLLDEPTNGLTLDESKEILKLIKSLNNLSVLIISHDIDFILKAVGRIIVLNQGKIIADGDVDEIQSNEKIMKIYMGVEENG